MSRTKPTDFEALGLTIRCDHCHARWGDWCVTASGTHATGLHSTRTDIVRHAWSLGYMEGEHYAAETVKAGRDVIAGHHRFSCPLCAEVAA